ncbi:hypothetical protein [Sulfurimonas sp. C5]|uniref:hypothetical protein n=1 Tax=Sulfurimonas sp. C5 TaxID=3036947 RepID=UPI0024574276|nr:hypothetical protein [Sulfurimonas sp. C5]MDH4944335.1 hypothetical protein [Sulfurimonas sp. C5]
MQKHHKADSKDGVFKKYYSDGNVSAEENYIAGQKHGLFQTWNRKVNRKERVKL